MGLSKPGLRPTAFSSLCHRWPPWLKKKVEIGPLRFKVILSHFTAVVGLLEDTSPQRGCCRWNVEVWFK